MLTAKRGTSGECSTVEIKSFRISRKARRKAWERTPGVALRSGAGGRQRAAAIQRSGRCQVSVSVDCDQLFPVFVWNSTQTITPTIEQVWVWNIGPPFCGAPAIANAPLPSLVSSWCGALGLRRHGHPRCLATRRSAPNPAAVSGKKVEMRTNDVVW